MIKQVEFQETDPDDLQVQIQFVLTGKKLAKPVRIKNSFNLSRACRESHAYLALQNFKQIYDLVVTQPCIHAVQTEIQLILQDLAEKQLKLSAQAETGQQAEHRSDTIAHIASGKAA